MHATRTGQECNETDAYRCVGCRIEQRVSRGLLFPPCPVCNRATTWIRERRPETSPESPSAPSSKRKPKPSR